MRLIFRFALLILTCLAPATLAQEAPDAALYKLVGPVRSLYAELAEARTIDGKLVEIKRRPHYSVTYNKRGNEVERVTFNQDGSIEDRSVQQYDAQGRLIGWKDYGNDVKNSVKASRTSSSDYDSKGNLLESRAFNGDALELRLIYTYDDQGRKIGESRLGDNGAHHARTAYVYNAAGQIAETTYYYNEVLSQKLMKMYDGSGNVVKEISINPQSADSNWTADYVYDNQGREIEHRTDDEILWSKVLTRYDTNGRVSNRETFMEYKKPNVWRSHSPQPGKVVFTYDERGHVIEESFYAPDGVLGHKNVSKFSDTGKLIEKTYLKGDGASEGKVLYEYDSWGNLVKRMTISTDENGRPATYIEYRTIKYY